MVLDYVSTDALEEVPTLNNFKKLTWCVLAVQIIVSSFYNFGRMYGSGIYYGWTYHDYSDVRRECNGLHFDNTDPKWTEYKCDNYFANLDRNDHPDCNNFNRDHEEWNRNDCDSSHYNFVEKCIEIRSKNNYVDWIDYHCNANFASPDVDYYCAWEIYECDNYFPHIVIKEGDIYYYREGEYACNKINNRDDYKWKLYDRDGGWRWSQWNCDYYLENFDSPNYICNNNITHKNWTQACNCKNYTDYIYHRYEKNKCTDPSYTATSICVNNDTNHYQFTDVCSCKDYAFDAFEWYYYDCNEYYSNEKWHPSYSGIGYPWIGGIWFVLAVWTTTLPQDPWSCNCFTAAAILINIAADGVNCAYFFGITTVTLAVFSFIIVFPCLRFIRLAFHKLENDTKEIRLINLRSIALNKTRIIFLIGLAQVYISLPSYQYSFEESINNEDKDNDYGRLERGIDLLRHLIPIAAGGMFNVACVVSVLFIDITKLHFVDFFKGELYNLEGFVGCLQFIGFALVLALTSLGLPTKDEIIVTDQHDVIEQYPEGTMANFFLIVYIYGSTMVCILLIWIFIISLAYRVKHYGKDMKYYIKRWINRETETTIEIREAILKNKKRFCFNMDEIFELKQYLHNELENLVNLVYELFSNGINKILFFNLIRNIQNEINTTLIETMLPNQSIYKFGLLTSNNDIMEDWFNLSYHKVNKPLKKLKTRIHEHFINEENKLDYRRYVLAENLTTIQSERQIPSTKDNWTKLFCDAWNVIEEKMTKIEDTTNDQMAKIETNIAISSNILRTKILLTNHTNGIEESKELENALLELEIYIQGNVKKLSTDICKQYSGEPYNNVFGDILDFLTKRVNNAVTEKFSSDELTYDFLDLSSDTNEDEQIEILFDKTFKLPLNSLKNEIIDYINEQKEVYKPEQRDTLDNLLIHIAEKFNNVVVTIENNEEEIKRKAINTLRDKKTSYKTLQQDLHRGTDVNERKFVNTELQQNNDGKVINVTNLNCYKKLEEQINQLLQANIQLQEDNKKFQEDNAQLQKDNMNIQEDNKKFQKENNILQEDVKKLQTNNMKLEEKLDVQLKNIYNILDKHNISS